MIPELIKMIYENDLITKDQYGSMQPLKKPYGVRLGDFLVNQQFTTKNAIKKFLEKNKNITFELFDQFMVDNSKIANAIKWREDSPKYNAYNDNTYLSWPKSKKIDFSNTFWENLLNIQPNLPEIPQNKVKLNKKGKVSSIELKPKDAWKYYIAYIAHSLTVEIDRLVHWSLFKYNEEQLGFLLDSRSFFEFIKSSNVYSILRYHKTLFNHGSATLGDPVRIFNFLYNEKLIGTTRWDSIGHFLGWCRKNMYSYEDGNTPEKYEEYWQFKGYPPVERVISGTKHPKFGFQHFTAGCWGTAGFIRTVLRTINIPVVIKERCGHALPYFAYHTKHKFYLSHGDDPYNNLYKITTFQFPPIDLVIDQYKFDEWFDKNLPEKTICKNVGKQVFELAVEYLPDSILKIYCDDLANGRTQEDGKLYNNVFKGHMTLNELKAFGLWDRLKDVVEERGGCNIISKL